MILLVPELSYAAGLTDSMRSNNKIMKDLSEVTKVSPSGRRSQIKELIDQIKGNQITREILSEWGLQLDDDIVQFTGRTLGIETLRFGNDKKVQPKMAGDWGSAAGRNPVLYTVNKLKENIKKYVCKTFVKSLLSYILAQFERMAYFICDKR